MRRLGKRRSLLLQAILRVALLYFLLLLSGAVIFKYLPSDWLAPFNEALAWAVQESLELMGVEAQRRGHVLLVPLPSGKPLPLYMVRHCLGVHPILGYVALTLVLPGIRLLRRLKWALGGTVFLGVANIARTAITAWGGAKYGLQVFDMLHMTVWRIGLSALALALALFFAFWIGRERESLFLPPEGSTGRGT